MDIKGASCLLREWLLYVMDIKEGKFVRAHPPYHNIDVESIFCPLSAQSILCSINMPPKNDGHLKGSLYNTIIYLTLAMPSNHKINPKPF